MDDITVTFLMSRLWTWVNLQEQCTRSWIICLQNTVTVSTAKGSKVMNQGHYSHLSSESIFDPKQRYHSNKQRSTSISKKGSEMQFTQCPQEAASKSESESKFTTQINTFTWVEFSLNSPFWTNLHLTLYIIKVPSINFTVFDIFSQDHHLVTVLEMV